MDIDKSNKRFWERFAFIYTGFMKKNDMVYDELCRRIQKHLTQTDSVLELACGTGQLTYRLAGEVKLWTATDFSPKMVEEAKKRGKGANIEFSIADATALIYNDKSFDAVVIANALHIMPEPDKAMSEIYRVLKQGGLLFAPTFVYDGKYNKALIWLMEKVGFHTFNKWKTGELKDFVASHGFTLESSETIKAKPLDECILIGCKK
jgi:ubiquinone/menaquinone biosynthesis C-methylase UbiE